MKRVNINLDFIVDIVFWESSCDSRMLGMHNPPFWLVYKGPAIGFKNEVL